MQTAVKLGGVRDRGLEERVSIGATDGRGIEADSQGRDTSAREVVRGKDDSLGDRSLKLKNTLARFAAP